MKKLLFILISAFAINMASAQCNDDLADATYDRLGDFTFLKEVNVQVGKKYKSENYPLIFNKGSKYRFTANSDVDAPKPLLNIYSKNGELIASNYDKESGDTYDIFEYTASQTGEYYATLQFNGKGNGCLIAMIGFTY